TTALGLSITPTTAKSIKLGDGHRVLSNGVCKGVHMQMGELETVIDALVLELGGMDMVLGVAWLSTLGKCFKTAYSYHLRGVRYIRLSFILTMVPSMFGHTVILIIKKRKLRDKWLNY
ncbi:peptidase aspartic active site, partial [Trifolium medium]|nr:peptidase aspartic active site [Trifolium medium]